MFKNALVSVSDKTGLVEFLRPFVDRGLRVVSTGGTAKHLQENGISTVDVSEQTNFPEVMGGRVKTLHPRVHMALLSRDHEPSDAELLKKEGLSAFDLVICNLYPFEAALRDGKVGQALIEQIDIGGPSMLRAAAKNFNRITVLCDPSDYTLVSKETAVPLALRQALAAKVFSHVSTYDSMVARQLHPEAGSEFSLGGYQVQELRYGENPQQKASWYRLAGVGSGLHQAKILQGKALSYNNLLDLDAAVSCVRQMQDPCAVAVKHNNPCGVAVGKQTAEAVERALKSDPVSVFGGIVAINREIDLKSAELLGNIFLECIVAPSFSEEAKAFFMKKKNLRVLEWPEMLGSGESVEIKTIAGGFLLQGKDQILPSQNNWQYFGEKPGPEVLKDMIFAEKVCASLKSNAIALVSEGQTVGLGMGQVNRIEAVEHAIHRMKTHFPGISKVVMASDAFFPFPDSIERACDAGIAWIVQPGGSLKDQEVISKAQELKVNMVLTGQRHFKH